MTKLFLQTMLLGFFFLEGTALAEEINVKNGHSGCAPCAATGDGTTDDLPALRSIVQQMSAGDTLYFPAGSYRFNFDGVTGAALSIDDLDNLTIRGDGVGASTIIVDHMDSAGVEAVGTATGFNITNSSGVTIRDLTVRGDVEVLPELHPDYNPPGTGQTVIEDITDVAATGIFIGDGCPNLLVEDVEVKWFHNFGIRVFSTASTIDNDNITLRNLWIHDITRFYDFQPGGFEPVGSTPYGFYVHGVGTGTIANIRIADSLFENIGNPHRHTSFAIYLGDPVDNVTVTRNRFHGNPYTHDEEIQYQPSALILHGDSKRVSIFDNRFKNQRLHLAGPAIVSNNLFENCYYVYGYWEGLVIENNMFVGNANPFLNGQGDPAPAFFLSMGEDAKVETLGWMTQITNNRFLTYEGQLVCGIRGAISQRQCILNNTFTNCNVGIRLEASDFGGHVIDGNTFFQGGPYSIQIYHSTANGTSLGVSWESNRISNNKFIDQPGTGRAIEDESGSGQVMVYKNNSLTNLTLFSATHPDPPANGLDLIGPVGLKAYTTADRNDLNTAELNAGTLVWDSDLDEAYLWDGTNWVPVSTGP